LVVMTRVQGGEQTFTFPDLFKKQAEESSASA
jgi:hypothetical protein